MTSARDPLTEVLASTGPVLLDFDGPITHLFIQGRNRMVADRMREVTLPDGLDLPEVVRDTEDPLVVLRWAAAEMPEHREEIERACIEGEVTAVALTEPTPGSVELLQACRRMRRPVVIVSNKGLLHHQVTVVLRRRVRPEWC